MVSFPRKIPADVKRLIKRLASGKNGVLVYDHSHRAYRAYAKIPVLDESIDIIGHYTPIQGRADVMLDLLSFEDEMPDLRRRPARGGRA